jgi:hypothetical protein
MSVIPAIMSVIPAIIARNPAIIKKVSVHIQNLRRVFRLSLCRTFPMTPVTDTLLPRI